jgi:serine/threonine-protein kinase
MDKRIVLIICLVIFFISAYIAMRVAIKGEEIEVPSLYNKTIGEAQNLLEGKKLFIKIKEKKYDDTVPEGNIISQDPLPGDSVKKGRIIWVVVSKGPEIISLPDLRGENFLQARAILQLSGLDIGYIARVHSNITKDKVITTSPEPLTYVHRNTKINILLSLGEKETPFIMPNLVGEKFSYAKKLLMKMKIFKRKITYQENNDVPEDTIISQIPTYGNKVSQSDYVELIVNAREEKIKSSFIPIKFYVPKNEKTMRKVQIKVIDDNGERVVFNEIKEAGTTIETTIRVVGDYIIGIYLDDSLEPVEEIKKW